MQRAARWMGGAMFAVALCGAGLAFAGAADAASARLATSTTVIVSGGARVGVVLTATVDTDTGRSLSIFGFGSTAPCSPKAQPTAGNNDFAHGSVRFTDTTTGTVLGTSPLAATGDYYCGDPMYVSVPLHTTVDATLTVTFPLSRAGQSVTVRADYLPSDPATSAPSTGTATWQIGTRGVTSTTVSGPTGRVGVVITAAVANDTDRSVYLLGGFDSTAPCFATAQPTAGNNDFAHGSVRFTDTTTGSVLGTSPLAATGDYHCGDPVYLSRPVYTTVDATLTVTFPLSPDWKTDTIRADYLPSDATTWAPSSATYEQTITTQGLTSTSVSAPPGRVGVVITAIVDNDTGGVVTSPLAYGVCLATDEPTAGNNDFAHGSVRFTDLTTGDVLGTAPLATSGDYGCPGGHIHTMVRATLTATFPVYREGHTDTVLADYLPADSAIWGPSSRVYDQDVVGPLAVISTQSGTLFRPAGEKLSGYATDTGGPGLLGVILYYRNTLTGKRGTLAVNCSGCYEGSTTATWSSDLVGLPRGTYRFVAQAVDVGREFGPGSNPVKIVLV